MNRLSIHNFGPVKEAVLDLKSFNLLIGEQSIGKSTIAKLIATFTDIASLAIIASSGFRAWRSRLSMYDLAIYSDSDYMIKYEYSDKSRDFSIRISKGRVNTSLHVNGIKIRGKDNIGKEISSMREFYRQDAFLNSLLSELKDTKEKELKYTVLSLQSLIESSLYVPAERVAYSIHDNLKSALSLMGEATTFTFNRFMVNLDKAKARLKRYDSKLLNMTYLNEDDGQFFIDGSSKKKYHLFNASSGIQSTIPLLLVLEDVKNRNYSSIVIEEPETNLYPNTQVEVLKVILKKASIDNPIVTITTHSPYLLSALNNFLYAGFIEQQLDKKGIKVLDDIMPKDYRINPGNCSVYSVGESINDGVYCKSLIDETTGMVDANTLDLVSFKMSQEFDALQDLYLDSIR